MNSFDRMKSSFDTGKLFEYHKWSKEIPYLNFPKEWNIKIIPPFTGAIVRFLVEYNGVEISVYLDCYDLLGFVESPYWEIYPSQNGDCERFLMNEVDDLLDGISKALSYDRPRQTKHK